MSLSKDTARAASSPSPSVALLSRLAQLTSTVPGLDASLMLAQYSSPFVIAVLLALARFRSRNPTLVIGSKVAGAGAGLVSVAEGVGKAALSIGEARMIMRLVGLIPVLKGLFALYPKPLQSLLALPFALTRPMRTLANPKALPTLQVLSLLAYFPLEHISWLGGKGVVPLGPARSGKAMLWAVRFWAFYVLLEGVKLRHTFLGLARKTKALKRAAVKPPVTTSTKEAEGFELQPTNAGGQAAGSAKSVVPAEPTLGEQKVLLKQEWANWQTSALVNTAYAPLTINWSTPGGLWTNPLVTSAFGTVAAVGQFTLQWRKTA